MGKVRKSFWKDERGSFSLEATLLLPIVFLCMCSIVFVALFIYLQSSLHQSSVLASERAAFAWDNSKKNPVTGSFPIGAYDGLYWRMNQDHAFMGLFGKDSRASVELPLISTAQQSVTVKKLIQVASGMPTNINGELAYTNRIGERKISAGFTRRFHTSFGNKLQWEQAQSSSRVADPVELIRTVELIRNYITVIQGRITPSDALATFQEPLEGKEMPVISSHAQAAAFLRELVGGLEKEVTVSSGEKRKIDSLDSSGIAHSAFYSFTNQSLSPQQLKDAELLKSSTEIRGVVWHFFKNAPSAKVRSELERQGIMIVIHE